MADTPKPEVINNSTSQMTEAPASVNFYAVTSKGWNLQITLRDTDEYRLLTRFSKLVQHLESVHVEPKQVGQQPTNGTSGGNGKTSQPEGAVSFEATQMTATVADGKTFWKVKGGKYSRWGVTIWPEVLKASGFDPDMLDVGKPVDLAGYTAHVQMEGDKAVKVTKLEKA